MNNCLLLLDPQNDFVIGSNQKKGSSTEDVNKLLEFLEDKKESIDSIVTFLDSHYYNDMSFPNYWLDFEGNKPKVGDVITKKEAKGRKYNVYMPSATREVLEEKQKMVVEYLENLSITGYKHVIQEPHCIIGTEGHNIYKPIMDFIKEWSNRTGKDYQGMMKGMFQHAEHFGVFECAVPNVKVPETMLNQGALQFLDSFDNVYIWGNDEVLHNTLMQLTDCAEQLNAPDIIDRYTVLTSSDLIKEYCSRRVYKFKVL